MFLLLSFLLLPFINSSSATERLSQSYPDPALVFQSEPQTTTAQKKLVPLVLGVMSKCPDAQVCEDVFDKVLAQVSRKVDLSVAYMGDIDPSARYGVRCRHGDGECRGNIEQLCYRDRFARLEEWWGFIQCQNYAGLSRIGEEMVARSCAKVADHDWEKDVKPCAEGVQGRRLLRSSVEEAHHLAIRKSCSILINHKMVCVHDGSWKDCPSGHSVGEFVRYIEQEFEGLNSA